MALNNNRSDNQDYINTPSAITIQPLPSAPSYEAIVSENDEPPNNLNVNLQTEKDKSSCPCCIFLIDCLKFYRSCCCETGSPVPRSENTVRFNPIHRPTIGFDVVPRSTIGFIPVPKSTKGFDLVPKSTVRFNHGPMSRNLRSGSDDDYEHYDISFSGDNDNLWNNNCKNGNDVHHGVNEKHDHGGKGNDLHHHHDHGANGNEYHHDGTNSHGGNGHCDTGSGGDSGGACDYGGGGGDSGGGYCGDD